MGKTADGAIWLDEKKLSNFDFFQFWRNVDDENVSKFLYFFTKLPISELEKLSILKDKEINEAKKVLAFEVTKLVRGKKAADEAFEISDNVFNSKVIDERINNYEIIIESILDNSFNIIDAVENLKLVNSRSEIKRLIKSEGIKIDDEVYKEENFSLKKFAKNEKIKISVGKKKIGVINIKKI